MAGLEGVGGLVVSAPAHHEITPGHAETMSLAQLRGEEGLTHPTADAPGRILSRDGLAWCAKSGVLTVWHVRGGEVYRKLFDTAGYSSVPVSKLDSGPRASPSGRSINDRAIDAGNTLARVNAHIARTLCSMPGAVRIVERLAAHGHTIREIAADEFPNMDRARGDLVTKERARAAFDVALQALALEGFFDARS